MPIGGFVINVVPEAMDELLANLSTLSEVEVHCHDKQGSVVAVIDTADSEQMEKIVKKINTFEEVLSVGLTYLNVEDEVDSVSPGDPVRGIFRGELADKLT